MSRHASLNRVYRVVYNQAKGTWQAVAEIGKSAGKTSALRPKTPGLLKTLSRLALKFTPTALVGSLFFVSASAWAASLPENGQVAAGQAGINSDGQTMTINQSTDKAAINWDSFNIGKQNSVTFKQPDASSVALNRVTGSDPSKIQGVLNANGQVFLVNPNGITFTQDAQVNVGGIVASTLDIATDDFMQGNYSFEGGSSNAILNQGNIQSADGYVAMIAAQIDNAGQIDAHGGDVLLGAGQRVTLDLGGPVKIEVETKALDAHIKNGGAILADGGLVYLTAKAAGDLASTVINNNGIIEAQTLASGESGEIYLMGDMDNDRIQVGGTLDASAPDGGDGGFIETSAAKVDIQPDVEVTTKADNGQTGEWLIDPTDIEIVAGTGGNFEGDPLTSTTASTTIGTQTLVNSLANSNITVQTPAADAGELGDITVSADIVWDADTILTLDAHNKIYVNALIRKSIINGVVEGGGVKFEAKNNHDAVVFGEGGLVVVINADQLQWINTAVNGNYAIYRPIDLDGITWDPIANFKGTLDGSTQSIDNLTISTTTSDGNAALFESIGSEGVVKKLKFKNANILTDVNGLADANKAAVLAAENQGTIEGVVVESSIVGHSSLDVERIGGLVAHNNFGDIIKRSMSSGAKVYANEVFAAGALVGQQTGGTINGGVSQASEVIIEKVVTQSDESRATAGAVGGFVGHVDSGATISLSNVYSNSVTLNNSNGAGDGSTGGIVGYLDGSTLEKSRAYGNPEAVVKGFNHVGGLVGTSAFSTIEQALSTYDVQGHWWVGGLVGLAKNSQGQASTILNSYAIGEVRGGSYIGGLVGKTEDDKIIRSYSIGKVIPISDMESDVGGLVGSVTNTDSSIELVENSLWDFETSNIDYGNGSGKGYAHPTTGDIGMDKVETYKGYGWDIVEDPDLPSSYTYPVLSFNPNDGTPGDSVWKIYGEPSVTPEPTPDQSPDPDPTQGSDPKPTPSPAKDPTPVPTPEPAPETSPDPIPEPTSQPQQAGLEEARQNASQPPVSQAGSDSMLSGVTSPQTQAPVAGPDGAARVGGLQVVNMSSSDAGNQDPGSPSEGESNDPGVATASAVSGDNEGAGMQTIFVVDGGIRLPAGVSSDNADETM